MTINVSPRIRIFAIAGFVVALAMLGAMFFLLRPAAASEPAPAIQPLYGGKKVRSAGATGLASTFVPKSRTAKPTSKPVAGAPAKRRPKPVTPARPQKVAPIAPLTVPNPSRLPLSIARQLVDYDVVVVALYNPESRVDAIALGEARAGAEVARARDPRIGFVALNVLAEGEALMKTLGVLPDPALFVYGGSGELLFRIDGFVDRDTVTQAALDAVR